jgi:hypothetical protein
MVWRTDWVPMVIMLITFIINLSSELNEGRQTGQLFLSQI